MDNSSDVWICICKDIIFNQTQDTGMGTEPLNEQQKFWTGDWGFIYTSTHGEYKNAYFLWERGTGMKMLDFFKKFWKDLPKDISILEMGCNAGPNGFLLRELGFNNYNGFDIQHAAIDQANKFHPDGKFTVSTLEEYTTEEKYDMVFTSTVLMHLAPENIDKGIESVYNASKKYIFGREFMGDTDDDGIGHSRQQGMVWARDNKRRFMDKYPNLKLLKEFTIPVSNYMQGDKDKAILTQGYLLEK